MVTGVGMKLIGATPGLHAGVVHSNHETGERKLFEIECCEGLVVVGRSELLVRVPPGAIGDGVSPQS